VEPTSNCSSASGGALFAGAAAVMQLVESETLILYHTDLRGQWPEAPAQALAAGLPYARRLRLRGGRAADRASIAGIALALRALSRLMHCAVRAGEIVFAPGQKPQLAATALAAAAGATGATALADAGPDFSISHSGPWVGCAAVARGRVGFDVELGTHASRAQWVLREAALKATGEGIRAERAARELRPSDGRVHWRGECWHVQRLEMFAGASACVVSSLAVREIEARAFALAELFAP
jgi:phosphopantetheinyl transferase